MKKFYRAMALLLCILLGSSFVLAEEAMPVQTAEIELIPEITAEPALASTPEPTPEPTIDPTAEPIPETTTEPEAIALHPAIVLDAYELVLGVKETAKLNAAFDDGGFHRLRYASSNARVAKVNKEGAVQGVGVGECSITVESEFGEMAEVAVIVKNAPKKLKLDITEARMGAGQTLQLRVKLPDGTAGAVKWSSRNPKIANVDQNGLVTALSKGSATIRVEAYNGRYADAQIQVFAAPDGIAFAAEEIVLGAGQAWTAEFAEKLPDGSYALHSENPETAAVEGGRIIAVSEGETLITAETYNGFSARCRVQVLPAPEKISFQEKEIVVCAEDSYTILPLIGANGTDVKLKIDAKQFKLSGKRLTGVYAGEGTLTAETYNGIKASIPVKCVAAPKKIAFKEDSITLFVGCEAQPRLNADCSYSLLSSDESIIAVEGNRIIAIAPGDAKIKATSFNKKTAVMDVHVPALPDSVHLEEDEILLGCGDAIALNARIPAGQGTAFRWESSDANVACVDESGNVRAIAPGSAEIRVHTLNGLTDSCIITILEAPTAISLHPDQVVRSLSEGAFRLELSFGSDSEGGRYSISSSDPAVAQVSRDGWVTPVSAGSAVIIAESYNGLRAKCAVILGETPSEMDFAGKNCHVALGDSISPELRFDRGCESYSLHVQDGEIAEIIGNRVRGLKMGNTVLTAVSATGLTAECVLHVVDAPIGLVLNQSEARLVLGVSPQLQLAAYALPGGVGSVRYASSDPEIAQVDENGLITALSMGECVISATTYDGLHSAECAISVKGVLDGVKVGIDPGHQKVPDYGTEPIAPGSRQRKKRTASGTRGRVTNTPEYVVNLEIGLKLREALEAQGATVYMTRTTHDVQISNVERAVMMNDLGCDVVLRIHCNGGSSSRQGMSIYVRQTGEKKAESVRAARLILKAMLAETGAKDRGVIESDTYTGLNWSTVPSMLMELGYLTNAQEDRLLNSDDYQYKLVTGMVKGVCAYMDRPVPDEILLSQEEKK